MPRELIAAAARTPTVREYQDGALRAGQIRVQTWQGAPKHGTELRLYRGESPPRDAHWDAAWRVFRPGPPDQVPFPRPLGNMAVGVVTEVGPAVAGVRIGDRVAGYGPLRETQTWTWGTPGAYPGVRIMPPSMTWQEAVCLDPTTVALGGIRDGQVRLGDRVAIFGLGAIGLLAVQLARLAGAAHIIAVDPIAGRRTVAQTTGAEVVLDPTAVDAGLAIREATAGAGVDVAIETSGTARALHHAVRGLAFGGTIAITAHCDEFHGGLDLGREAHYNRPRFVFPRAESEPHADHPRWNHRRLADVAWELLAAGRLVCDPLIHPVVPFDQAAEAFQTIDRQPERSVKLGVVFRTEGEHG